jgi:hypothetical protein
MYRELHDTGDKQGSSGRQEDRARKAPVPGTLAQSILLHLALGHVRIVVEALCA